MAPLGWSKPGFDSPAGRSEKEEKMVNQQKDVIDLGWELDTQETERMCPNCYQLRHVSQFEKSVTVAYLLNLPASVTWCTSCREGS